ncbi:MAG: phosphoglycerate dehydrogenase [Dehalococcoidales bacterium]|nr:phosphoglycerate dehydrogenase [Dehalococcoidales bacterium]
MPHKVLITSLSFFRYPGRHLELLQESGCEVIDSHAQRPLSQSEMIKLVADVDAIIAGGDCLNAAVIAAAPRLKVISRQGVGYDAVDVAAATRAGVVVTTTPGANHVTVAELALGLMIALARQLQRQMPIAKAGLWDRLPGIELAGKTLGIVGLGRIGKALATRAKAMEIEVVAYDVLRDRLFADQHSIRYLQFNDLLIRSDFVSLHAPASPGTPPMIGENEIRLMKPTAFLVNTARGSLVDENALYLALKEDRLAGAALDCWQREPPAPGGLLALDKVLPTPHVGGMTHEASVRGAIGAAENTLQVLRGERCSDAVNPDVYELASARARASG